MSESPPLVSVVTATYNRSEVLAYAIRSVLGQRFTDFEHLVIGDGCTDASESVVRSFGDRRLRWANLPQNSGSQSAPNNRGLELARGQYVAYLGHDDLWHPEHLAVLVSAIEASRADLAFSITLEIGPAAMPTRWLLGLCPRGVYEWSMWVPPSAWLHRRDVTERIGVWRDYRTIALPPDTDFLDRVYEHGCRITPADELTVFKFTSALRTHAYLDHRADEQGEWWRRLGAEPDLRYRELMGAIRALGLQCPDVVKRFRLPSRTGPGEMVEGYRARRGLRPGTPLAAPAVGVPLSSDRSTLRHLNADDDIGPAACRRSLHEREDLPSDGLFVGFNWYSLETDSSGTCWRWMDTDAQVVVTRPSGARRRLVVDLAPGPGLGGRPGRLQVRDTSSALVAEMLVDGAGPLTIELPAIPDPGAVYSLGTEDGGRVIRGDPRTLNFRVFGLRWEEPDERLPGSDVPETGE
jgi:glycosyltransferase involved in cell wall biosynthesis